MHSRQDPPGRREKMESKQQRSGEQAPTPTPDEVAAPRRPTGITTLRPEHLYKAIGLFFLLLFFYRFFDAIQQTFLLIFASAILAVALNPLAKLIPVQRRLLAAAVGLLILVILGGALWLTTPVLLAQIRDLVERAPELQAELEVWAAWVREETGINVPLIIQQGEEMFREWIANIGTEGLFFGARGILEAVLVPLIILLGGLYALANPNARLLTPLMYVVPRDRRPAFQRMFHLLGERLFDWIRGRLVAMVAVGILSAAVLLVLDVPYWLVLAVIIAVVEFIPIIGPWIGGIPAVVIAFLDDPIKALWVALAITVIQQVESYLITPWAMSEAADIHPLITLFSLILFGTLFGFLGILLALPLVIVIWTVVEVLWVQRAIDTDEDYIPPVVEE